MADKANQSIAGYWYHPVFQMALCSGPVDSLNYIYGDTVQAWRGNITTSQTFSINQESLWGGESSEGGIVGDCEIWFGDKDQLPSSYLNSIMPDPSAHRGVVTYVFKGGKFGAINPYPKPLSFQVTRVLKDWLNDTPWYPEKAPIVMGGTTDPLALYLALDLSGSMQGARLSAAKASIINVLNFLANNYLSTKKRLDIAIVGWSESQNPSLIERNVTQTEINNLVSFVNGLSANGSTTFDTAFNQLETFFSSIDETQKPYVFFVTDGEATVGSEKPASQIVANHPEIQFYGMNIELEDTSFTAQVDNTPQDGVPVIQADGISNVIQQALQQTTAINAVHVIYDILTHPHMMSIPIEQIDDDSFKDCADIIYDEGFGICTTYNPDNETTSDFIKRICNIIGANVRVSTQTGKWQISLIRGAGSIDELPILTNDDILDFTVETLIQDDTINEIRVEYYEPANRQINTTASVQALSLINQMGVINSQVNQYHEISSYDIAAKLALRDLQNNTTSLIRFEIVTNRKPYNWNIGTYFNLSASLYGIDSMACIVTSIDKGSLRSNAIRVQAVQDIYSMPQSTYLINQAPTENRSAPKPSTDGLLVEAPYIMVLPKDNPTGIGADDIDSGAIMQMAKQPQPESGNYKFYTQIGSQAQENAIGIGVWTPTIQLADALPYDATTLTYENEVLLNTHGLEGSPLYIGDEILGIVSVDANAKTMQIKRGCADTIPLDHDVGSTGFFFHEAAATDGGEYLYNETITTRIATIAGKLELPAPACPKASITIKGRLYRPYPPAKVRVNGQRRPTSVPGSFQITWNTRNFAAQQDQLIDTEDNSVPVDFDVRFGITIRDSNKDIIVIRQDILSSPATVHLVNSGEITINLYSINTANRSLYKWKYVVQCSGGQTKNEILGATYNDPATIIDAGDLDEPVVATPDIDDDNEPQSPPTPVEPPEGGGSLPPGQSGGVGGSGQSSGWGGYTTNIPPQYLP